MEGFRGDKEKVLLSIEEFGGYKTEVKERIEERERLALRNKAKEEKHSEIYGGLRQDIGRKRTYTAQWTTRKAETAISRRGPGSTRKRK